MERSSRLGSMSRCMVRLACGSISTSRTRYPPAGQSGSQVDGRGGLSHAALLVDDGNGSHWTDYSDLRFRRYPGMAMSVNGSSFFVSSRSTSVAYDPLGNANESVASLPSMVIAGSWIAKR